MVTQQIKNEIPDAANYHPWQQENAKKAQAEITIKQSQNGKSEESSLYSGPAYQLPAKFPSFVFLRGLQKKAVVQLEEDSF